jgi:hypothetical protein
VYFGPAAFVVTTFVLSIAVKTFVRTTFVSASFVQKMFVLTFVQKNVCCILLSLKREYSPYMCLVNIVCPLS